jgi:hypothetical protein
MGVYKRETMIASGFTAPKLTIKQIDAVGAHLGATSRSQALRIVIEKAHSELPKKKQVK